MVRPQQKQQEHAEKNVPLTSARVARKQEFVQLQGMCPVHEINAGLALFDFLLFIYSLEFSRIEGRGQCQHTSCKSCFLLTQPTCDTVCPDPPKKRCLRQFFNCVLQHFFNRTTTTPNHLLVSIAKKDAYWP